LWNLELQMKSWKVTSMYKMFAPGKRSKSQCHNFVSVQPKGKKPPNSLTHKNSISNERENKIRELIGKRKTLSKI
jgi:hypothetical protein